ncbi:MAG: NAD(+) synthase [Clostridia bacterium]|nr:NAD(+) synthase [Clostridia bacterium]
MRDWQAELDNRVAFLRDLLASSGAKGFIFGNSGGKDSALVGILCRKATENVLGVIMPCASARNYGDDRNHALLVSQAFDIPVTQVDLTTVKENYLKALDGVVELSHSAQININPRLRMTTVYAMGQSLGYLVAGTGNRSEVMMGYFTKWGDGAYDVNPIGDLLATEVFEFLRFLGAPAEIIDKAPSAGLYEGQTDEKDMGVSYAAIDKYLSTGEANEADKAIIDAAIGRSAHKRRPALVYSNNTNQ